MYKKDDDRTHNDDDCDSDKRSGKGRNTEEFSGEEWKGRKKNIEIAISLPDWDYVTTSTSITDRYFIVREERTIRCRRKVMAMITAVFLLLIMMIIRRTGGTLHTHSK